MNEETLKVLFNADNKSFMCPNCGKVLNEHIRNNGVITISHREYTSSQRAILCFEYCPNCFQRLSFDGVLDYIAEYIPEVKWESVKVDDIAEKIYNAATYNPWVREMPTTD